jgi:ribose transport system substrate-binding protein
VQRRFSLQRKAGERTRRSGGPEGSAHGQLRRRTRDAALGCAGLAVVGLLAACSSAGSSSSAAAPATGASLAASASPGVSSATSGSCETMVNALLSQAPTTQQADVPAQQVNLSKLSGGSIWDVDASLSIPADPEVFAGVKAAAAALGMTAHVFDGKGQETLWQQGVQEAIAQHAKGILLSGIDPALVSGPVAAAKAAGIPIIDSNEFSPGDKPNGIDDASVTVNYPEGGAYTAAQALKWDHCSGDIAIFTTSDVQSIVELTTGAQAFIAKACPTACKSLVEDLPITELTTQDGPTTRTLITRYPNFNAVIAPDAQLYQIAPAISAANASSKVKGFSDLGDITDLPLLKSGEVSSDYAGYYPYVGWLAVDELGRLAVGASAATEVQPYVELTPGALQNTSTNSLIAELGNYQAKFEAAWGVSK